jgi:hypothetical protein
MENKNFDLGTVLSITTGILLTDIGNVYEILDYMTDDQLFTHQLPRVGREMEPILLEQFPQLKGIDTKNIDENNWKEFLDSQIAIYGNSFVVIPVDKSKQNHVDPLQEMTDMLGGDTSRIIPVIV